MSTNLKCAQYQV